MPIFKAGRGKWMKLCEQCKKPFVREARCQRKCNKCQEENKSKKNPNQKSWLTRYNNTIEEFKVLEKEINNKTLKQYHIIVKAYEYGLKLWKFKFNYSKLAQDLNISHTHLKRLISLKNCTPKTWELLEKGTISANKVAIITFEKGKARQDELIDWAIRTKATNIDIHHYLVSESKAKERVFNDIDSLKRYIETINKRIKRLTPRTEEKQELIEVLKKCDESIQKAIQTLSIYP